MGKELSTAVCEKEISDIIPLYPSTIDSNWYNRPTD